MNKEPKIGWMVISLKHPNGSGTEGVPAPVAMLETLSVTPEEAIEKFCANSLTWAYWQDNYGYEVKKVKVTIELL